MIGKITIGKSFRGCILYCLSDKQATQNQQGIKNRAEIIAFNQCFGNARELIEQFNDVSQLNRKLAKPVMHITLSLAKGDKLNPGQLENIIHRCAKQLGFESNQYLAVRHKDTAHAHLHIIANRVGYDGKTVKDSNNYQRIAQFCRTVESLYGLQKVQNPKRFQSPRDRENTLRLDKRKEKLKADIKAAIQSSKSLTEFTDKMQAKGYSVIKTRGIAFRDQQKVYTKGSQVGYSLATIERQLASIQRAIQAPEKTTITQAKQGEFQNQSRGDNHPKINVENSQTNNPTSQEINPDLQLDSRAIGLLKRKRKKGRGMRS